jgi:tRNA A-37 threonylcarbamoyl transferase component Bud32
MSVRILLATPSLDSVACQRLEEFVAGPDFRPIKSNERTTAGFLRYDDEELFVKRKVAGSWFASIIDSVRGSSARRTLRGAAILDQAGFAHPKPVAAFEWRKLGFVQAGCVISAALTDANILSRFALTDGRNFRRRKWISEHLAGEIRRLHEAGIYTRDLQETNLMLAANGTDITVYFVDLEDFRRVRSVSQRRRMLNLIHLDRSIGRFVSRSQRLRFLYNYLGEKPGRAQARRLVAYLSGIRGKVERSKASANIAAPNKKAVASTPTSKFTRAGTAGH